MLDRVIESGLGPGAYFHNLTESFRSASEVAFPPERPKYLV